MIETLIGLAAAKYLCSGWKSDLDRAMENATKPPVGDSPTMSRLRRDPRIDPDSLRILNDGFSETDYAAFDAEAQQQAKERQALSAQFDRIEALVAKIQRFP